MKALVLVIAILSLGAFAWRHKDLAPFVTTEEGKASLQGSPANPPTVRRCTDGTTIAYRDTPCPTGQNANLVSRGTVTFLKENRAKQEPSSASASLSRERMLKDDRRGRDQMASSSARASDGSAFFRCDGRTHCSQMHSCEEATYFMKNCPGVKMDGNNDGIPCEKQWCN
jgi:hypothetical protein